jgi:hypothetical protein
MTAASARFGRSLRVAILLATLFAGLLPGSSTAYAQITKIPDAQGAKVWVNTRSGVYHCPGSQYYGTTKSGTPMLEQDARKRGYRPAGGFACTPGLSTKDSLPKPRGLTAQPKLLTKVWVNTNSGVYHCPGSRSYGKTKRGEFMTEGEARSRGYRAAYGRACQ